MNSANILEHKELENPEIMTKNSDQRVRLRF